MIVVPSLNHFRRIVLLLLALAVACIPAVAASSDIHAGSGPEPRASIQLVHGLRPFINSSLSEDHASLEFNSWNLSNEDDSEEVLSVESFSSPVSLISDRLPLPLLSSIELHCSSIFRVLTGHIDVSHLRGPPSPLFM